MQSSLNLAFGNGKSSMQKDPAEAPLPLAIDEIRFLKPWGSKSWLVEHHEDLPYTNNRPPHVECQGDAIRQNMTAKIHQLHCLPADTAGGRRRASVYCWKVQGVSNGTLEAHFTVAYGSERPLQSFFPATTTFASQNAFSVTYGSQTCGRRESKAPYLSSMPVTRAGSSQPQPRVQEIVANADEACQDDPGRVAR